MIDERWLQARRILAVRLDNLGDVILTGPAISAIKHSLPTAEIALLAGPAGAQAGYLHPDIDRVIEYQAPWTDPWNKLAHDPERELRICETLRNENFDAAIIFTSFRQSSLPAAYLCYLAGIPLRHAASIDGPGSLLTSRHRHPERLMHEVDRGLDLVSGLGMTRRDAVLSLAVPDQAREKVRRMITGIRRSDGPVIAVHPGCSMPARTYPWQQYAEVCDLLVSELDATAVLTGTEEERELTRAIGTRMTHDAVDMAGALDFPLLCALIEAADLTITNNTGPMHVAAAVQTPVVALFALTNPPEQWGPWKVPHRLLNHDVPCRICYSRVCPYQQECLSLVRPSAVVQAASELLSQTRRPKMVIEWGRSA
jgi:ADP-heptose:LPS heptosyltransferase